MPQAEHKIAIERLALFFYFSFLDDDKAYDASIRSFRKVQKFLKSENSITESELNQFIVKLGDEYVTKAKTKNIIANPGLVQGRISFPSGSDWGAWFSFRRNAEPQEFYAVLWTKILKLPIDDVAIGLCVSVGTLQYRMGHGLRSLGAMISKGSMSVGN